MTDQPATGHTPSDSGLEPAAPPAAPAPQRFWISAVSATGLAFLAGWFLMPPLAPLLYVMGLFFFLLVGLLIGATAYRIALAAAPIPRKQLLTMTSVVSLTLWATTMFREYQHLPTAAHEAVRKSFKVMPNLEQREKLQAGIRQHLADYLKTAYPPGGILGYAQWSLVNGELDVPRVVDERAVHLKSSQRGFLWGFRVLMSLVFTAGAFASQVLSLGPPKPAPQEPPETPTAQG